MDIQALVNYNRQIMETREERNIIEFLLRFMIDLTEAKGVSFVPLDENGNPAGVVRHGEFPVAAPEAWLEYLALGSVRQSCQACHNREQLMHICPLLQSHSVDYRDVFCLPLMLAGQELGIINLFEPDLKKIEGPNRELCNSILDITALAIQMNRQRSKVEQTLQQLRSIQTTANPDLSLLQYKTMLEERFRLGREIHDGLAQTLGFLKLQVTQMQGLLDRQEYDRVRKIMRSCYQALTEAYHDAREAVDNLRLVPGNDPECRFQDWLQQTVNALKEDVSIHPFKIQLECMQLSIPFPPEVHAQLIRIAQEALSNIRKHAQAKEVVVRCGEVQGDLILEIRDDGCGFDVQDIPGVAQHGLRGMRERAELIGADLQIHSSLGHGTTVYVRLPKTVVHWMEI